MWEAQNSQAQITIYGSLWCKQANGYQSMANSYQGFKKAYWCKRDREMVTEKGRSHQYPIEVSLPHAIHPHWGSNGWSHWDVEETKNGSPIASCDKLIPCNAKATEHMKGRYWIPYRLCHSHKLCYKWSHSPSSQYPHHPKYHQWNWNTCSHCRTW